MRSLVLLNLVLFVAFFFFNLAAATSPPPTPSRETVVIHTTHGTLELRLWPSVAPKTVTHILRLFDLGAYNTDHFFRVDKGFVAQLADVKSEGSLRFALDARQLAEASKTVPLEAGTGGPNNNWPRHDRAGLVSMARQSDRDSGRSSFSVMLGPAPHLDGEYTLFGEVVNRKGFEDFKKRIEALPTTREGIFVMPKERVEVLSSYVLRGGEKKERPAASSSSAEDDRRAASLP